MRTGELTSENLEIQQPGMVVLDHWSTIDRVSIGEKYSYALVVKMDRNQDVCFILCTSGETLCRDNCQLIGMPFFYTRSAGKNNRN